MYEIFLVIFGISISIIVILSIMKKQALDEKSTKKTSSNSIKKEFKMEKTSTLDLSKLTTNSINIFTPFLWKDTSSIEILSESLELQFDDSTYSITGLIPYEYYSLSISLYVYTKSDISNIETESFTSPLYFKLGFGTETKNDKITRIIQTEKNFKVTQSPFTCNLSINVNIETDMFYPYIFVNDATKELLLNKTDCYGKMTITVIKLNV
jgi:hypothetical protein